MSGGTVSRAMVEVGSVLAVERVLPAPDILTPLLPAAGLQRGSVVGLSGPGSRTLLLALLAAPVLQGCWAAVVGFPDIGLEAAVAAGVDLQRLILVPDPGVAWTTPVAVLLEALDLVALCPPGSCLPADGRRLVARARERGSVLLIARDDRHWTERPDLELMVEGGDWEGLNNGAGTLRRRRADIIVSARRAGGRRQILSCWLPGPDGRLSLRSVGDDPRFGDDGPLRKEAMAWVR